MRKLTLVATILGLVSYSCHSLALSSNKTNDLLIVEKNEGNIHQNDGKNQYLYEKMNKNNNKNIDELVWSKNENNTRFQKESSDFSSKMLSARDTQTNRQLLNESQERFVLGEESNNGSDRVTLSMPIISW